MTVYIFQALMVGRGGLYLLTDLHVISLVFFVCFYTGIGGTTKGKKLNSVFNFKLRLAETLMHVPHVKKVPVEHFI